MEDKWIFHIKCIFIVISVFLFYLWKCIVAIWYLFQKKNSIKFTIFVALSVVAQKAQYLMSFRLTRINNLAN